MSLSAKREYLAKIHGRYQRAGRPHKSRILARPNSWESRVDAGNPRFRKEDRPMPRLVIEAAGPGAIGSWRWPVYLNQGRYAFEASARREAPPALSATAGFNAGVRPSDGDLVALLPESNGWHTVRCEFNVTGGQDMELVCELRADYGMVAFDASSARLVKLTEAPLPSQPGGRLIKPDAPRR